jgi:hypothetical protein
MLVQLIYSGGIAVFVYIVDISEYASRFCILLKFKAYFQN